MNDLSHIKLNKDQKLCFELIESTSKNYLIQGKPGVGKSVLIKFLTELGIKRYTLTAPTGLAALNIEGRTIHSIFRLPISDGIIAPDFNNFPKDDRVINNIKYNIKHLIIDEVSMVRADVFDYIDRLMQFSKGNNLPFGGAQVIVIGDFYQLPPVVKREEVPQLRIYGYSSPFIFSSAAFQKGFEILSLNEVMRQKGDPSFIDILHSARTGSIHPKQIQKLNLQVKKPKDLRIKLTSTNMEAEEVNKRELSKIDSPQIFFQASKFGEWPAYPAEEVLALKVGSQVMVKKNNADIPVGTRGDRISTIVNGTLGKIIDIEDKLDPSKLESLDSDEAANIRGNFKPRVLIELDNGNSVYIYIQYWERKKKELVSNEWQEIVVASYSQMPLALAWAMSIHKSQGQSFDKVHIDAARIFAPGQLYVAVSRCRKLRGISFESNLTTAKFFANRDVVQFFEELENETV